MPARKKQTDAHKKELSRIRKFINRAEKRGFRFTQEFKENLPSLRTQSLKSFTPEKLYSIATALSSEGDIVSGTERRKEERSESAKKAHKSRNPTSSNSSIYAPKETDVIYGNIVEDFIEKIQEPTPEYYIRQKGGKKYLPPAYVEQINKQKTTIYNLAWKVYNRDGEVELARRLNSDAVRVNELIQIKSTRYDDEAKSAMTELATIINGGALTMQEAMDIGEQEEYNDSFEEPE